MPQKKGVRGFLQIENILFLTKVVVSNTQGSLIWSGSSLDCYHPVSDVCRLMFLPRMKYSFKMIMLSPIALQIIIFSMKKMRHKAGTHILEWSLYSPDLSPLERAWDMLGQLSFWSDNPPISLEDPNLSWWKSRTASHKKTRVWQVYLQSLLINLHWYPRMQEVSYFILNLIQPYCTWLALTV